MEPLSRSAVRIIRKTAPLSHSADISVTHGYGSAIQSCAYVQNRMAQSFSGTTQMLRIGNKSFGSASKSLKFTRKSFKRAYKKQIDNNQ